LEDYLAASRARREINSAVEGLFGDVDFLLSLVSPVPAPAIGQTDDLRDLVLPYTVLQNLGGFPACAFPIGFDDGLPVGAQLTGPRFSDYRLLDAVSNIVPDGVPIAG
jgi:Asp-tRNA(Asn)/Glu-tRNA(Gln) amidotransferase A subunit family amidase